MTAGAERAEAVNELRCPRVLVAARRMTEYSNEPVFRQRTRRPPRLAMILEPIVSDLVVDVIGVEQRDEHVDVEQGLPAHASSSSSSATRFIVRIRDPGRRGRTGTPLRTFPACFGSSALRASSDSTCPAVFPRIAPISLAACNTSSSRSSVVRIVDHHASRIRCQEATIARRCLELSLEGAWSYRLSVLPSRSSANVG